MPAQAGRHHLIIHPSRTPGLRQLLSACLLFLFLISTAAGADIEIAGRQVLLIVSRDRDDRHGEWLELSMRGLRHELGLDARDLPVVRMGFADPDVDPKHFQRLGFKESEQPLLALVEWSNPDTEGPLKVVERQVLTRVYPEQGLEEPKRLLAFWLRSQGREELAARLVEPDVTPPPAEPAEPAPQPEVTPAPEPLPLPEPALLAFEQRRYAEAIILARQNGDKTLEEQAQQAFRQQALLALDEGRRELALSVYSQLAILYPDDTFFATRVKELSARPEQLIVGRWKIVSGLGWAEFAAASDGSLEGKAAGWVVPIVVKWEGRWELTGAQERSFRLHWKHGNLHDVTVSEDGRAMTGTGLHEGEVKGTRLNSEGASQP